MAALPLSSTTACFPAAMFLSHLHDCPLPCCCHYGTQNFLLPHLHNCSLPCRTCCCHGVQNFRAKKGTAMALHPEPSLDELAWTVAAARVMFGPHMNIQVR